MAKAKKLPSGNWRCRASFTDEDGVQHSASFTADTAKLAEAQAAMWRAGMLEKEEAKAHMSLKEAIEHYLETGRCTGMSPTTIRAYVSAKSNAFPQLIERRIDRITLRDIQTWVNARAKEVSPKTLKNNLGLLTAVLKSNGIKLDYSALKLPQRMNHEMEIPSDAQVSAMLEDVYDCDDMYLSIALAALMGLRRSEICALKWTDITLDGETPVLSISKALVMDEHGLHVEKTPKTHAGRRTLVIPGALYAEMKRRRNLRTNVVSITPNAITERYQRLAERLGVPPRFHNLRHYHASVMLREGVPEKYIIADMGHSSFEMVKRVYGHVMEEKRSAISVAMDNHATSVMNPSNGIATGIATT